MNLCDLINFYPLWNNQKTLRFYDDFKVLCWLKGGEGGGGSLKKMFLKILQNSLENICARVLFNQVEDFRPARDYGTDVFL